MPARRLERPGREPVTLRVDGEDVSALRGEPIAMSLLAAGKVALGRSVKYHRPRGATCFSGRCDGCLMRVDGVPSVRTCRTAAEHDTRLETQNVVGSAELDLLSAADWFFPGGMNHHEMFTWARPVNQVMQLVAREVAGIGTLPSEAASVGAISSRAVDVVVVGAGAAGLAATRVLARAGLAVLCVDEEPQAGGWLRFTLEPGDRELLAPLLASARESGAELALRHVVVGIFDEPEEGRLALVEHASGLWRVRARAWVLAVGRTEGSTAFEGSDLPLVVGAEGAARVLAHDIVPGERVVLAGDLGSRGEELASLARALREARAEVSGPFALEAITRADGRAQISSVTVVEGGRSAKLPCDLLVVAPATSAAYELPVQAGARTELSEGVFELVHTAGAHAVWIVGSARARMSAAEAIADGERAAHEIVAVLGGPAPKESAR